MLSFSMKNISIACLAMVLACGSSQARADFTVTATNAVAVEAGPAHTGTVVVTGAMSTLDFGLVSETSTNSEAAANLKLSAVPTVNASISPSLEVTQTFTITEGNQQYVETVTFDLNGSVAKAVGGHAASYTMTSNQYFDVQFGPGGAGDFQVMFAAPGSTTGPVLSGLNGTGILAESVFFVSNAVPEPTSMVMLGLGGIVAAIGAYRNRRLATSC